MNAGTWRSYQLMTHGYTVQELINTEWKEATCISTN